jgi:hypothetical protein
VPVFAWPGGVPPCPGGVPEGEVALGVEAVEAVEAVEGVDDVVGVVVDVDADVELEGGAVVVVA